MSLNLIYSLHKLILGNWLIQKPGARIPERQNADRLAEICGIRVFNARKIVAFDFYASPLVDDERNRTVVAAGDHFRYGSDSGVGIIFLYIKITDLLSCVGEIAFTVKKSVFKAGF